MKFFLTVVVLLLLGSFQYCHGYENGKVSFEPTYFAIFSLPLGLLLCFMGYRCFELSLWFCSFTFGGILGYTTSTILSNDSYTDWLVFMATGIGMIGLYVYSLSIGIVSSGGAAGATVAIMLNTLFGPVIVSSNPNLLGYIFVYISGICGGFITLHYERKCIIISLSFLGAFAFFWSIGYFIGNYPPGLNLFENISISSIYYSVYVPGTIVLTIIGSYVQFHFTALGISFNIRKKDGRPSRYISQDITYHLSDGDLTHRIPSIGML